MLNSLLEFFNTTLFHLFGVPTTVAEVLGFITGAWCVWLVVRQNIWTFPLGILNAFFFMLLFYDVKLYADGTLQIVYMILGFMGLYAWLRFGPDRSELSVSTSTPKLIIGTLIGVAVLTAGMTVLLESLGDSNPFLDALTTSLSLAAQFLLTFKKLENWYLWILADVIYIPLYVHKDLLLTAIVYVVFLTMCVIGLRQWKQSLAKTQAQNLLELERTPLTKLNSKHA
jgi:nicotinamide mononucleotide transporter